MSNPSPSTSSSSFSSPAEATCDRTVDFVVAAEELALQSVQLIRRGVDCVRQSSLCGRTATTSRPPPSHVEEHENARAQLWIALEQDQLPLEIAILYDQVWELSQQWWSSINQETETPPARPFARTSSSPIHWLLFSNHDDTGNSAAEDLIADERSQIVYRVALPLLAALGLCYEILDTVTTSSSTSTSSRNNNPQTTSSSSHQPFRKSHTSTKPPPPPIGMLSLQNYTDVACWLEWTIVVGVLSCGLLHHVLVPLRDRVRYQLPKALVGRLPPACLLVWDNNNNNPPTQESSSKANAEKDTASVLSDRCRIMAAVAYTVTRVLLLDRFRPMLLPRHLTDVCAAVFYVQHQIVNSRQQSTKEMNRIQVRIEWIAQQLQINEPTTMHDVTPPPPPVTVDPLLRARTYQTLLRQGRLAPVWLRHAVSDRLSTLATTHLAAVTAVFVVMAGGPKNDNEDEDDSTWMASLRLARALVAEPTSRPTSVRQHTQYLERLCDQLLVLLDSVVVSSSSLRRGDGEQKQRGDFMWQFSKHHGAILQTVWAVLDALPKSVLEGHFGYHLVGKDLGGMFDCPGKNNTTHPRRKETNNFHRVIQRWGVLLSGIPLCGALTVSSSSCVSQVCCWWLRPVTQKSSNAPLPSLTLLGAIVRLAAVTPSVIRSRAKEDALWTLRLWVEAMMGTTLPIEKDPSLQVAGPDALAFALLWAMAPSDWDWYSNTFALSTQDDDDNNNNSASGERIVVVQSKARTDDDWGLDHRMVEGIEDRAKVVIQQVLAERIPNAAQSDSASDQHSDVLVAVIFRVLLMMYFSERFQSAADDAAKLPFLRSFNIPAFQTVSMICLPLLCESCTPESLLATVDGCGDGIFAIMQIVFDSASDRFGGRSEPCSSQIGAPESLTLQAFGERWRLAEAVAIPGPDMESTALATAKPGNSVPVDSDMLLSVTTILLGLLVSILELGSEQRSLEDEQVLQSFTGVLQSLAEPSMPDTTPDATLTQTVTDIAEMASHALALVASRRIVTNDASVVNLGDAPSVRHDGDPIGDKLCQAENDMRSQEPPIRARGMVTLRHLANALGGATRNDESMATVVSVNENKPDNESMLLRMLRVALDALKDSESYVYLAAIHTIVAIAEAKPATIVPILGFCVTVGVSRNLGMTDYLTPEQRAKLAESIIFLIRRRGSFDRELPILIDLLVRGPKDEASLAVHGDESAEPDMIRERTHKYFIHGSDEDDDFDTTKDKWKEIDIRVRTGGPLFATEEGDVVRAARINMVSELVSVLPPAIIARHCSVLVDCCIDALRKDATRPVRRAGGSLSRDLYAALVREMDSIVDGNFTGSDVPLATAVAESRDAVLLAVLERCVDSIDVKNNATGKVLAFDPATAARCQEAIHLRSGAEKGGILTAGRLAAESKRLNDNPIARMLQDGKGRSDATNTSRVFGIVEMLD